MSSAGLESQDTEEDVMAHVSGLSRGDKRRNERLARLRELVPPGNAILGIDLADDKQVMVLTDQDSRVLARKRVRAKPGSWDRHWSGAGAWRVGTGSATSRWPVNPLGTVGGYLINSQLG